MLCFLALHQTIIHHSSLKSHTSYSARRTWLHIISFCIIPEIQTKKLIRNYQYQLLLSSIAEEKVGFSSGGRNMDNSLSGKKHASLGVRKILKNHGFSSLLMEGTIKNTIEDTDADVTNFNNIM